MANPNKNILLLCGDPGSGKSLCTNYLENYFWLKNDFIPLRIELSRINQPFTNLVAEGLGLEQDDIRTPYILKEWQKLNIIFILDGYDEINPLKFKKDFYLI